ncbi:hypothetical protein GCM10017044_16460 [Kordiimonas sediminis]|uniref:ABM domain-containing protein n=1 Tax=Kordiimonas sediminis TaxID=1735581 RepID=A0A919E628_9PROT|nr:antibiotic biosynthesis monooxygenase [Kordiimonas sediminis]GHF22798.1 hypothetical protein GCM10017044_16460 [Kordiimonas sediminis]
MTVFTKTPDQTFFDKHPYAQTPEPPYYAVIFSNQNSGLDPDDYGVTATAMEELAATQDGYLGIESTRNSEGYAITVSYWRDLDAIKNWKQNVDHTVARNKGRDTWYQSYYLRVAKVEKAYCFEQD